MTLLSVSNKDVAGQILEWLELNPGTLAIGIADIY